MHTSQSVPSIGPAPRSDAWRLIGPGEGGPAALPTISPHDPNVIVQRGVMCGNYLTTDGGRSWRMFNLRSGVCAFAFDPVRPAVMYVGTVALWRSEDAGRSWRQIFPAPARNTRESLDGDHSHLTFTTDDAAYPVAGCHVAIQAIAADPANSRRIYIAFGPLPARNQGAVMLLSEDDGANFTRVAQFRQERVLGIHVPTPGATDRRVRVLAESGVYVAERGEWRHAPMPAGAAVQAVAGQQKDSGAVLVYAICAKPGAEPRLFVSPDGGETWSAAATLPGTGAKPTAVACAANDAAHAYLGFSGLARAGDAGTPCHGIARTGDGGQTWAVVFDENDRPAANLDGGWYERWRDRSPHAALDAPTELAVGPRDPRVCCAVDLWRTYRTADGGATWEQVSTQEVPPGRWTTRGLDMTNCYSVDFDPFNAHHMLVPCSGVGVLQSADGGESWAITTAGLPGPWRRAAYAFAFDPSVRGRVWGAFSSVHDLPRPKMWRHRDPDTYEGGVGVSNDGGATWQVCGEGLPPGAVTHVLLDPASPPGRRTLHACLLGRGVYRSTDDGRTWAAVNRGIEGRQPFAWRLVRAPDGALFLVVARRSEDGSIGNDRDGALYESTDGAETWRKVSLPDGCNGPAGLAFDPRDARRLYLAAWGRYRAGGDLGGGVYRSDDRGRTWRCAFDACQHVYDVTLDPSDPSVLYIGTFDMSAWRSDDAGATWSRLRGYTAKWGHRVIPDPRDPDRIYITTYGSGIWHGPARGDPGAAEDLGSGAPPNA